MTRGRETIRAGRGAGADLTRERSTSDTSTQTLRRRSGRLGRRGFAVAVAAAVILVLLGTVAYAAVRPASDEAAKQLLQRSGRVKIKNSRGGDALVGMRGMLPGDSVAGTVTIGNASKKLRARFYLGLSKLVETQGTGGGRLSYRLVLTVKRLATNRRPQLVYSGPLRQMPLLKLGTSSLARRAPTASRCSSRRAARPWTTASRPRRPACSSPGTRAARASLARVGRQPVSAPSPTSAGRRPRRASCRRRSRRACGSPSRARPWRGWRAPRPAPWGGP